MEISRRKFIAGTSLGLIGAAVAYYLYPVPTTKIVEDSLDLSNGIEISPNFIILDAETQKTIEAFLEVLLPGSKKLGIKDLMMKKFYDNKGIGSYVDSGIWNLHALTHSFHKKKFYELETKEEIDEVVNYSISKNYHFYRQFRKIAIQLYYSHPETYKKLNYSGPPQPLGFLDYHEPPKSKA